MLRLEAVETFYGPVQALFGVDLAVAAGQVVALMGRNGMGKTTTIRSILQMTPHTRGRISFEGRDLAGLGPHRAARLGLGLVPEGRRCFANLTVAENLIATQRPGPWDRAAVSRLFPRLAERSRQMAATLSGGEQQMLAIGRALMARPRLLLLDEPSLGLAPMIVTNIFRTLRELREEGNTIFLVEQNARRALQLADEGYVLERGRISLSGAGDSLLNNVEVQRTYLGKHATERTGTATPAR